ncbi:MAG: pseudaminic acid cytidylyltransferase [Flavobacterium sp.]|jgi:pseudaminic acid cytidylyltransferase
MAICVIPARGGSKRIPRKNIKGFHGKPMIQWSIEAAKASNVFDNIIVSTDDDEIGQIAESLGALVPFKRPLDLSDDYTNTTDVIAHASNWSKNEGLDSAVVCCLYATAPFVQPSDLAEAYRIISTEDWQYVFSVGEYSSPILRSFEQEKSGGVKMFFPEYFETRSQDLPAAFFDAGMFYMATSNAWINNLRVFDEHSFPLKIPSWRIQDIDTPEDWERAEEMAKFVLNV